MLHNTTEFLYDVKLSRISLQIQLQQLALMPLFRSRARSCNMVFLSQLPRPQQALVVVGALDELTANTRRVESRAASFLIAAQTSHKRSDETIDDRLCNRKNVDIKGYSLVNSTRRSLVSLSQCQITVANKRKTEDW